MKLEDMDCITAPPGSILVLRPSVNLSPEQLQHAHMRFAEASDKLGVKILFVPKEMDVHVLCIEPQEEVMDVTSLASVEAEDQAEMWDRYDKGFVVQWEHAPGEWVDVHIKQNPIPFANALRHTVKLRRAPQR